MIHLPQSFSKEDTELLTEHFRNFNIRTTAFQTIDRVPEEKRWPLQRCVVDEELGRAIESARQRFAVVTPPQESIPREPSSEQIDNARAKAERQLSGIPEKVLAQAAARQGKTIEVYRAEILVKMTRGNLS